jgi:hypothetical protein
VITVSQIIAALQQLPVAEMPKVIAAAAARWGEAQPAPEPVPASANGNAADDDAITVEEAALMLCRSPKWISRHRAQLPFIRKLGPRSYVCLRATLIKWREHQRA